MKRVWLLMMLVFSLTGSMVAACNDESSIPEKIVINARYTANPRANTMAQKYGRVLRISGANLLEQTLPGSTVKLLTYDPGISVTAEADGVTFTNTTTKNQFFQIRCLNEAGCFDFTALQKYSGKIGIDFHVDVNGNGGGGTYLRGYNTPFDSSTESDNRVVPEQVVKNGTVLTNAILSTYVTNPVDNVYFKFTVPKGGTIKIYDIYLYMETMVTGFAGMAERITGGAMATEADTHVVTNAAEFYNALNLVKAAKGPAIIKVNGTISFDDYWNAVAAMTNTDISKVTKRRYIDIGGSVSNLTIMGEGTNSGFDGIGLKIAGTNTIIRNLTIHSVLAGDGIQVNDAKYTWIDHCTFYNEPIVEDAEPSEELKDKYDELISIKNNSEFVIISWNLLYDSYKTILVGSNDTADALPDRKVIIHHNWFKDCNSRLPLYRGGYAHIYNNYYQDIRGSGVNCRTGSKVRIEHNYFENVKDPIGFWYDTTHPSGLWEVRHNRFSGCTGEQPVHSTCRVNFELGYHYRLDPPERVKSIVVHSAGAGNCHHNGWHK
ncbi:MAG TPA: right-handed parallel beta-helix repeat-containing protein [Bacillota bacterium]|nr:right-handed parallel beta-helix repeat-containing protein [Bacillota bacterium]